MSISISQYFTHWYNPKQPERVQNDRQTYIHLLHFKGSLVYDTQNSYSLCLLTYPSFPSSWVIQSFYFHLTWTHIWFRAHHVLQAQYQHRLLPHLERTYNSSMVFKFFLIRVSLQSFIWTIDNIISFIVLNDFFVFSLCHLRVLYIFFWRSVNKKTIISVCVWLI